MSREAIIRLIGESREDGSLYISSPEIPLLQLVVADESEIETVVLPILKEMMERTLSTKVQLRLVEILEIADTSADRPSASVPAHVIAQMAPA